jgi:predicted dienelactone hydrolase
MAADHPGSTFGGISGDSVLENFALRPTDVLRQIAFAETLTAPGGALAGLIDMNRVAVTGHSFGGFTAISAGGARLNFAELKAWCDSKPDPALMPDSSCNLLNSADKIAALRGLSAPPDGLWEPTSDPRIRAMLLQAPSSGPAFGKTGLAAVTIPTMIIVGSKDAATIPERDAYPMYEGISSSRKMLVVLQHANHYIFVDECVPALVVLNQYPRCSDAVWDMDRAHDLINHLGTAFFLATLKDDTKAKNALEISAAAFPGVDYRSVGQ